MKRFSTLLLLVACAVMAQAQKLDTQLMLLVGQSGTRGEQVVTNQKVLQDKLCANLNADQRQDADAAVYNLMGQKVERNHKGIVISNGRKYVRK